MVRKRRKTKEPFWKKFDPELQHVAEHLGKVFDNSKPSDFIDIIAASTCAVAGRQAAVNLNADWIGQFGGAGLGILGYQLARSDNLASGAAGVGVLAGIGVVNVVPFFPGFPDVGLELKKFQDFLGRLTTDPSLWEERGLIPPQVAQVPASDSEPQPWEARGYSTHQQCSDYYFGLNKNREVSDLICHRYPYPHP